MISSKLEDDVVWLILEGELIADEVIQETAKWLSQSEIFIGFITDIRKLTSQSASEQKKVEDRRKQNKSNKPNAILGKDNATAALVKIYIRFTKANDTRYFTDPSKAKQWLHSFK